MAYVFSLSLLLSVCEFYNIFTSLSLSANKNNEKEEEEAVAVAKISNANRLSHK